MIDTRETFRNAIELMQGPARFMGFLLPGTGVFREFEELNNKLEAFRLFEYADRELNLPRDPVWSLYSVLLRRKPASLGGMPLVLILALIGLPFLGAGYAIESRWLPQAMPGWPAVAGVLYLGAFASVAA